jgi:hypothetical protein
MFLLQVTIHRSICPAGLNDICTSDGLNLEWSMYFTSLPVDWIIVSVIVTFKLHLSLPKVCYFVVSPLTLLGFDVGKFSFAHRVVDAWNSLGEGVVACDSIHSFKHRLDNFLHGRGL